LNFLPSIPYLGRDLAAGYFRVIGEMLRWQADAQATAAS